MFKPIFSKIIGQQFAENNACYRTINGKSEVISISNGICPDGYKSVYSQMKGHNGIDLVAYHGQPLLSPVDGKVTEVCTEESRGLGIGITSNKKYLIPDTKTFEQIKIRLWHLKNINVSLGQIVYLGDFIGNCDNTGWSSGDHLHLEVKPVNEDKNILQNNGYFGAINPSNFFEDFDFKVANYGESGEHIKHLQMALKLYYGLFPLEQKCTGYFGNITRKAVFEYQKTRLKLSWYEKYILCGNRVGEKTITDLNLVFK